MEKWGFTSIHQRADVPLFDDSDALNTFQVQLIYSSGEIIISYKDLSLSGSNTEQAPGGSSLLASAGKK